MVVVARFPAGPRVSVKTVDPLKGKAEASQQGPGRVPFLIFFQFLGSFEVIFYFSLQPSELRLRSPIVGKIHFGRFSAGLKRFGHRGCFNWMICCRMMHSHLDLVQQSDALAEMPYLISDIHRHHVP